MTPLSVQTPADTAPWTSADTVLILFSFGALFVIVLALSLPEILRRWRATTTVIREAEHLTYAHGCNHKPRCGDVR